MSDVLVKLFEHNNWANARTIEACAGLTDEQLDAVPMTTSEWSIREVLVHLVESQRGYLLLLTVAPEAREFTTPAYDELTDVARQTGEGLLALAREQGERDMGAQLITLDGYEVRAWVVMLQAINHATDHRRQIGTMMRTLGLTPPNNDGWIYGESEGACIKTSP